MKPKLPKRLGPAASRKAVAKALRMVAESDLRMNRATPAERAELERDAREMAEQRGRYPTLKVGDYIRNFTPLGCGISSGSILYVTECAGAPNDGYLVTLSRRKGEMTVARLNLAPGTFRKATTGEVASYLVGLDEKARAHIGDSARKEGHRMHAALKDLHTPAEMLKTLRMAYQHVLDEILPPQFNAKRRLTVEQQRDLGRRLATYWSMTEEDVS